MANSAYRVLEIAMSRERICLPSGCTRAAVAARARSTNASWRALAVTSMPEVGEAVAAQRDTTCASKASWLSRPCKHITHEYGNQQLLMKPNLKLSMRKKVGDMSQARMAA